jgi:hypothetical protein
MDTSSRSELYINHLQWSEVVYFSYNLDNHAECEIGIPYCRMCDLYTMQNVRLVYHAECEIWILCRI